MSTQQVFNVCVSLSLRLMTFQHIFLSWEFVRKVFQFDVSCAACSLAACSWQHSALVLDQGFLGEGAASADGVFAAASVSNSVNCVFLRSSKFCTF